MSPPSTTEGGLAETEGGDPGKSFAHTQAVVVITNNPTILRALLAKNRTHLKTTWNNTPGSLPDTVTDAIPERRPKRLNPNAVVIKQTAVTPK